jgi:hypothetical protein
MWEKPLGDLSQHGVLNDISENALSKLLLDVAQMLQSDGSNDHFDHF